MNKEIYFYWFRAFYWWCTKKKHFIYDSLALKRPRKGTPSKLVWVIVERESGLDKPSLIAQFPAEEERTRRSVGSTSDWGNPWYFRRRLMIGHLFITSTLNFVGSLIFSTVGSLLLLSHFSPKPIHLILPHMSIYYGYNSKFEVTCLKKQESKRWPK